MLAQDDPMPAVSIANENAAPERKSRLWFGFAEC